MFVMEVLFDIFADKLFFAGIFAGRSRKKLISPFFPPERFFLFDVKEEKQTFIQIKITTLQGITRIPVI